MRSKLDARRRLLIAGVAAALLAGAGVAYATIPDAGGVVHTCYTKSTGSLRVIDTGLGQTCKANEAAVDVYSKGGADLAFLAKTGKAADSDKLDGQDSTAFLGASAKATDSDRLDGRDSSDFLGANATAADSAKLGGFPASRYVFGGGFFFTDFNVVADNGVWSFDCCAPIDPLPEIRFQLRCDTAGGSTLVVSSLPPFRWWWDETSGDAMPVGAGYEATLPIDGGTSRNSLRAVSSAGGTTTLDLDMSIGAACHAALTMHKTFNVSPGP
jgi:hypothetical protein